MKLIDTIRDRAYGVLTGLFSGREAIQGLYGVAEDAEIRAKEAQSDHIIQEALSELEISVEDQGWRELTSSGLWNFSRATVKKMITLSRLMYLVNPLIKRAVTVQELYVWGSGCTIRSENKDVDEVLRDFFEDPKNQSVIGAAWAEREREQRIEGNTFFVLFRNRKTGAVRVRLLPVDQVTEIICNPDDAKEPWFYKRDSVNSSEVGDLEFNHKTDGPSTTLYPDIDYTPTNKPAIVNGLKVEWDSPVLHVKTGGLSTMRFGIPELYSVLNWATAYKRILENFATILAAYARVAMQIKNLKGKAGVAAAKSTLGTAITPGKATDTNPPPNTASWALFSGGVEMAAVKTANSTTGPDEARALRSMVAAGSDTPEHFFGDSDIGNFATSTTLDRPTELKMIARQGMWQGVILRMAGYLIKWSAQAPSGKLRAASFKVVIGKDFFDNTQSVMITPPTNSESIRVLVTFPSILERDVVDRVRAVVQAATLGGRKAEGIIPSRKFLFKLLMVALGEKNAEEITEKLYPKELVQGFIDPADELKVKQVEADAKKTLADKGVASPAAASN